MASSRPDGSRRPNQSSRPRDPQRHETRRETQRREAQGRDPQRRDPQRSDPQRNDPQRRDSQRRDSTRRETDRHDPDRRDPRRRRDSDPNGNGVYTGTASVGGSGRPAGKPKGKPRKKVRSPLWTKLVIIVGALIIVASGSAAGLLQYSLNQINNSVASADLLGDAAPAKGNTVSGTSIKGPINILLVGVDTRPTGNIGSHSDSMIIVHIPASHDHAYLVSIPRDTHAVIPADPKTHFAGGGYKINAAFTFGSANGGGEPGGFSLLAKTIEQTWGITFNGGAIVNFDGFKDIVNKLGGVDMYVDETTYSIHHGVDASGKAAPPYNIDPNTGVPICYNRAYYFDSNPDKCTLPGIREIVYKKGFQHLSAYAALDFVRCRDGLKGTDYARQRHQQQFIKAVLKEVYDKGLSDPLKLQGFIASLGQAITFDRNGVSLSDWIWTMKGISPDGLVTIKTNNGDFVHYTGPAPDSEQALSPVSEELFSLLKADKTDTDDHLQAFIAEHPDWVANS